VHARDLVLRGRSSVAAAVAGRGQEVVTGLNTPKKRALHDHDDAQTGETEVGAGRGGGAGAVTEVTQKKRRGVDGRQSGGCGSGGDYEPLVSVEAPLPPSLPTGALIIGIREMWVSEGSRLRGIATSLLETARATFQYRAMIARKDVAFSQPTASGEAFAFRYCNGQPYIWTYSLSSV
jgi:hypothetical protein